MQGALKFGDQIRIAAAALPLFSENVIASEFKRVHYGRKNRSE